MKAVHFGAGNIGRGFIGLLLSQAGYDIVFADVNKAVVDALIERGKYTVVLAGEERETVQVDGVTALNSDADRQALIQAIAEADLVTTAVGVSVLKHIAGAIAGGIERRIRELRSSRPLHIIACENAIGASTQLRDFVYAQLDEELKQDADKLIAFPDAAVDRIVPGQSHKDILKVTVEPFYEWVVDASQMFQGYIPIPGVKYVPRLQPYIERKLFTVNTGHCSVAYFGNLHEYDTIHAAMDDPEVARHVANVLKETGAVLVAEHGFDEEEHLAYIVRILQRFRNPALRDEVVRVGRSPIRKLSPGDRLALPAAKAFDGGRSNLHLARTMAAALLFRSPDDPEAQRLTAMVETSGPERTVTEICGFPQDHPVQLEILNQYELLQSRFFK
ncbi:mannitol-1-phosphate 5-dehydrogenase [Paenibacillus sp. M1]|uniref:Mannitol-1-phosphate 5-dehydrogenase n=1 Tax=Paenibacillus haidiansis TaxID=1574488 RepID=A0ABU7VZJ8_9BACL